MIVFRSLIVLSRYLKCGGRQHIVPLLRRQAEFDLDAFQLSHPRVAQCPQHQERTQSVAKIKEEAGYIGRAYRLPCKGAYIPDDEIQVSSRTKSRTENRTGTVAGAHGR